MLLRSPCRMGTFYLSKNNGYNRYIIQILYWLNEPIRFFGVQFKGGNQSILMWHIVARFPFVTFELTELTHGGELCKHKVWNRRRRALIGSIRVLYIQVFDFNPLKCLIVGTCDCILITFHNLNIQQSTDNNRFNFKSTRLRLHYHQSQIAWELQSTRFCWHSNSEFWLLTSLLKRCTYMQIDKAKCRLVIRLVIIVEK